MLLNRRATNNSLNGLRLMITRRLLEGNGCFNACYEEHVHALGQELMQLILFVHVKDDFNKVYQKILYALCYPKLCICHAHNSKAALDERKCNA